MSEIAAHGHGVRGMSARALNALAGNAEPGKFGRMFAKLPPLDASDDALFELAQAMLDNSGPEGDNPNIPAGYTYLGQFVDHDITLDTTPLEQQELDPLGTKNFRSPNLDLDSLYGDGPGIHPYLYALDKNKRKPGPYLLIGKTERSVALDQAKRVKALRNDLPRNAHGHALIFDERNDENLLVAQFHLLMLKFHNAVVRMLEERTPGLEGLDLFKEARRIVTWHYQWIVLFDFAERLTEPGLIRKIKDKGRQFYRFANEPFMPAEFAAAAYRLGHSMIRETYSHNSIFRAGGFGEAGLDLLFHFTGKSGRIIGDLALEATEPAPTLVHGEVTEQVAGPAGPMKRLPSNWAIDWRRFFDLGTPGDDNFTLNLSRRIDPFIVPGLHKLPGRPSDVKPPEARNFVLPFRNLRRGVQFELPSGQDVCRAMGFDPLPEHKLCTGPDGAVAEKHGFHKKTPLWYYILKEAEQLHDGKRLGPVGSTIIAETFLGLVHGDKKSFLYLRSNWTPELLGETPGHFTMADLIRFVGDINPVDGAIEPA